MEHRRTRETISTNRPGNSCKVDIWTGKNRLICNQCASRLQSSSSMCTCPFWSAVKRDPLLTLHSKLIVVNSFILSIGCSFFLHSGKGCELPKKWNWSYSHFGGRDAHLEGQVETKVPTLILLLQPATSHCSPLCRCDYASLPRKRG